MMTMCVIQSNTVTYSRKLIKYVKLYTMYLCKGFFVHNQVRGGTVKTYRSEKTKLSVKAERFFSWRSEISGHFLHFT